MPKRLLALAFCVALAACSDDSTGPDDSVAVEGTYTLQSINGRPLPVTLLEFIGLYRLQQVSGTMTLNTNHTFEERALIRETTLSGNGTETSDTTVILSGSWELEQDSVITLTTQQDGSVLFGVASNGRLTLHYEPQSVDSLFTYVYRK